MAKLVKRGSVWHFDFRYARERYQGSTHLKNKEKAESYVAAFRTNLVNTGVGLTAKEPAPILSIFLKGKFLDSVRQNAKKPRTRKFYEEKVKQLCEYVPFTQWRLDRIDELAIQGYKDFRLTKKLSPATINGELRTLRKALIFADTCGLSRYRRFRTLPGETNRTFILDGEMEKRYLGLADYPLRQVAILMLDLGLRPEECVSMRKADVSSDVVSIRQGKTPNARRALPQTGRTREVFDLCASLFPDSEWVFPGSKGEHFTRGAIDNLHTALRKEHDLPAEFVLYSCRHTFATRLAESCGGDLFVLKEALGHGNTQTCQKYVHTTPKHLGLAFKQKELLDRMLRGEVVTTVFTTADKKT